MVAQTNVPYNLVWFLSAIPINGPFGAVVSVDDAFKNPWLLD